MTDPSDLDPRVRVAAFRFLEEQTRLRGKVLPREVLAQGFDFEGQRVPLIGPAHLPLRCRPGALHAAVASLHRAR
ncbi:MAG: hypothetical protein L0Z62_14510 [Gemmataceae bacterium]|nr:hypothetical protein [Gemmataceae bacterium]